MVSAHQHPKHTWPSSAPTDLEEIPMKNEEPERPKETSVQDPSFVQDLRSDRKTLALGLYPGDIHPGLLSGVGIDDKKRNFGIDKTIFAVTGSGIVDFVLWGLISPESVATVAGSAFNWSMDHMGWLLKRSLGSGWVVMMYVAFGK